MANGESFFIIGNCEGELSFGQADSPEALSEYLTESEISDFRDDASDWEEWGSATALIVKGAIVIPKAKQVATRWEVER